MTRLTFEPIYGSALLVLFAAVAMVAVMVTLRSATKRLNVKQVRTLIGLRATAAVILLLGMLRPSLVTTDQKPTEATLAVLLDRSRSMTLPAGNGQDRATLQKEIWRSLSPTLQSKEDDSLKIQVLEYAGDTNRLNLSTVEQTLEQTPQGTETNLQAALRSAIASAEGHPLAGVVLIGDGADTSNQTGPGAQQSARTLAALDIPLWAVPIGPTGSPETLRDVEIVGLQDSFRVFSANAFEVTAIVHTKSLVGVEVPIRFHLNPVATIEDRSEKKREVASRTIVPRLASDSQAIAVELIAPKPGRYVLELSADLQVGEVITKNNRQLAFVDVREGGGRILYLEGELRQEQTFLKRALRRFPDLDLTYRWIGRDTATQWPLDFQQDLLPNRFDIYILGDLDASAIGNSQLQELADRVGGGAGLLMLGGMHTFGVGGYANSPLAAVLPIRMNPSLRRSISHDPPSESQLSGMIQARIKQPHPITKIGNASNPQQDWDTLRPLKGAYRFHKIKEAPGVRVLLESPNQNPLLVAGEYGAGRIVTFAGDTTWKWWRQGASERHRRFWRQVMLWLMSRDSLDEHSLLVEMDARRFLVDQPPEFRVHVGGPGPADPSFDLKAEILSHDGVTVPVSTTQRSTSFGETVYFGTLPKLATGLFRLRASAVSSKSDTPQIDERFFQVIDQDREHANPFADPGFLQQLATLTSAAGGRVFASDQITELLETLRQSRQQTVYPVVQRHRLGDDAATGWLLLASFIGVLVAEWGLRRRWGLA